MVALKRPIDDWSRPADRNRTADELASRYGLRRSGNEPEPVAEGMSMLDHARADMKRFPEVLDYLARN
jgi:hypothetical protein